MSLFERIKNKRYDLQEKRKFPGDESGAYKQAKDDLEARKGFSKNKPGGLKADEKNPYVKRSVRKARVDKLGGDIYDAPKFTQKGFEKSLKDTQKVGDKAFKSDVKKFKKIGLKPPKRGDFTSKSRPGGKLVIPDPFGKGDTPGQIRVKGLETKAFKKTKPSDIKLPKSFTDFEKNLQDYKDKDKATMRTGKSSSKVKVSGANNLTRQDVGMAPPDKPKTKVVKQSEVSKKAKDFTKNINQQRKVTTSGTPMRKGATSTPKNVAKDVQVGKMKNRIKELSAEREKMRSFTGKKDVKGMRKVNRQIKQYQKSIKSNPFVPTVYDPKNAPKKSTPVKQSNVTVNKTRGRYKKVGKKSISDIMKMNTIKGAKGPTSMKDVDLPQFTKTDSPSFKLSPKGQRVASKIPKAFRGKGFAKVGKAILKNPYVATAAAVGIGGYAAYKGIKGLLNKPKAASLKTTDLKPGRTVTYGRDDPKGKFKKGDDVRFDALGLGFTKKAGVQKKKPTFQDFQSGKYQYTSK